MSIKNEYLALFAALFFFIGATITSMSNLSGLTLLFLSLLATMATLYAIARSKRETTEAKVTLAVMHADTPYFTTSSIPDGWSFTSDIVNGQWTITFTDGITVRAVFTPPYEQSEVSHA